MSLQYWAHFGLITSFDYSNVSSWLRSTLSRGLSFCRSGSMRLYASVVLPIFNPFRLFALIMHLLCLVLSRWSLHSLKKSLSASFSSCLEIHGVLVTRLANSVNSTSLRRFLQNVRPGCMLFLYSSYRCLVLHLCYMRINSIMFLWTLFGEAQVYFESDLWWILEFHR